MCAVGGWGEPFDPPTPGGSEQCARSPSGKAGRGTWLTRARARGLQNQGKETACSKAAGTVSFHAAWRFQCGSLTLTRGAKKALSSRVSEEGSPWSPAAGLTLFTIVCDDLPPLLTDLSLAVGLGP